MDLGVYIQVVTSRKAKLIKDLSKTSSDYFLTENKAQALKVLQSRLLALKLEEKKDEENKLRGEHLSAGWGNQIRSYVLHPYKQVKDHRTNIVSKNPNDVLNGNIDEFIEGYLKAK